MAIAEEDIGLQAATSEVLFEATPETVTDRLAQHYGREVLSYEAATVRFYMKEDQKQQVGGFLRVVTNLSDPEGVTAATEIIDDTRRPFDEDLIKELGAVSKQWARVICNPDCPVAFRTE